MKQLFLCYRADGAQTAKLFSFYMKRNYPQIPVWYSDKEYDSNYSLQIPELIAASYGVVIFLSKDFTKGFLDKAGKINANCYRTTRKNDCVTALEIIEIEKALQTRPDFELHIVNLDGATLRLKDQRILESLFAQAGILQPDSVARFAQRNVNTFHVRSEPEEAFFDRMIASYLPGSLPAVMKGNFSVGRYATSVDILCWDCKRLIEPRHIVFQLDAHDIPFYTRVEMAPLQEEKLAQDDDVLSVTGYDQWLTSNEEKKHLGILCKISKYHLFKKTLDLWDKNGFLMSREISRYLNGAEEDKIYPIPNAMGLALMAVTADNKLIFSRRSPKRRVRSGEFDCSIVEGLLTAVDKQVGGRRVQYDYTGPDYAALECRRAFCEEICVDDALQARIFGLIFDRKYGQWNLTGLMNSSLTAAQIEALHATRDDTTEETRLYFVDYLDAQGRKDLGKVREALRVYRKDGFWDTALTALYGALLVLGFSQDELASLV